MQLLFKHGVYLKYTLCMWALPLMEVQWYNTSNTAMQSKYSTHRFLHWTVTHLIESENVHSCVRLWSWQLCVWLSSHLGPLPTQSVQHTRSCPPPSRKIRPEDWLSHARQMTEASHLLHHHLQDEPLGGGGPWGLYPPRGTLSHWRWQTTLIWQLNVPLIPLLACCGSHLAVIVIYVAPSCMNVQKGN